ncbi:MAG: hypothetical protein IT306_12110 [Chloroflexi bacterium]|nr:hypothetical protein [Chloroflexota bacterium]
MGSSPQRFPNEQAEAHHWLGVLKDGPHDQKIAARIGLARIFERRGMPDEAVELLVTCIEAGHHDVDVYESLGRLYAVQGRQDLSVRARAEAQRLRVRQQREREEAEARARAEAQPVATPTDPAAHRRRGLVYIVSGASIAVGGFLVAMVYGQGVLVILYALSVAGVAMLLHGVAALAPRR